MPNTTQGEVCITCCLREVPQKMTGQPDRLKICSIIYSRICYLTSSVGCVSAPMPNTTQGEVCVTCCLRKCPERWPGNQTGSKSAQSFTAEYAITSSVGCASCVCVLTLPHCFATAMITTYSWRRSWPSWPYAMRLILPHCFVVYWKYH